MKFFKGLALGAYAFGSAFGADDCPAGQAMGPVNFVNNGGMFCETLRGSDNRGCTAELSCTSGQMKRSMALPDGSCGEAACVDWPPTCPGGQTWRTVVFEDQGGYSCTPKKGYSYKNCGAGPNKADDCAEGTRPKSMLENGVCQPKACVTWPPECAAGEEFRPINFYYPGKGQFCRQPNKNNGQQKVKGCRPALTCAEGEAARVPYDANTGECGERQCVALNKCAAGEMKAPGAWNAPPNASAKYCRADKSADKVCVAACPAGQKYKSVHSDGNCAAAACVDKPGANGNNQNAGNECADGERTGPVVFNAPTDNSGYCVKDNSAEQGCVPKCASDERLKSVYDADAGTCAAPACEPKN
jgi:hypothetical protein